MFGFGGLVLLDGVWEFLVLVDLVGDLKRVDDVDVVYDVSIVEELYLLQKVREVGVVYMLGDSDVYVQNGLWLYKWIIVNYIYSFLCWNCWNNILYLSIFKVWLFKVGMEYYV